MKFKVVFSDMHFGNGRIESGNYTKYFQGKVYLDGILKGRVHVLKYMRGIRKYRYAIYQLLPAVAPRSKPVWQLMEQGTEADQWIDEKRRTEHAGTSDTDYPEPASRGGLL